MTDPDNKNLMTRFSDGLRNLVSGLGTSKSKREHNQFVRSSFNQNFPELDAAYAENWIARAIVDYPAEDMTREWRRFKCDEAEAIQECEEALGVIDAAQEALQWSRLYGGSGILMVTDQDPSKPLNLDRIKKDSLKRLVVFDRWSLAAQRMNVTDILSPSFLKPEFYTVEGGSQLIHWSHIVRFDGAKMPIRQRRANQGWGDSELRKCFEDLKDTVAAKGGIAELMQEANIDVITREGLNEALASDEEENNLIERYQLYSQMKSFINMALLDSEETFDRKTLNMSGVAQVLEILMTWVSGAADIHLTRLFGTSAKGMNATGEGDRKNYYNSIGSKQASQLTPAMRYLDQVMIRSAVGYLPETIQFEWNPLEQQSDIEIAQGEYMRAQKDQIYLDLGVVKRSQVQRRLQASDQYQFDEQEIAELEKFEEANLFEEPVIGESEEVGPEIPEGTQKASLDSGFNEADVKRDEKGRFSETGSSGGGGASSNQNQNSKASVINEGKNTTQIANTGRLSENLKIAKEKGYNTDQVFVHASRNSGKISEISSSGNFPGLFSLASDESDQASTYGENSYSFVIKGEPWGDSEISDAISNDYEKAESVIRDKTVFESSIDEFEDDEDEMIEKIISVVSGETLEWDDDVAKALNAIDEADYFKEAQSIRAHMASAFGAPAIRMDDEFGDSTVMILPGDGVMMVGDPETEDDQ